ncbi:MAG: hypothetical protein P8188_07315 [Gemmatimonadota bacterium]|jgi:membrane protein implicated in regulation of membrane protease activity
MMAVYLFALILGGGLLLLSLLGGEGGDVDVGDLELDGLGDAGDLGSEGGDASASKIFSLRSLIYAVFGFGATGALLTTLGLPRPVTLGGAIVTGLLAGAMVSATFGYLHRTESGTKLGDEALLGLTGRVVLPIERERPGAVVVIRGDRRLRLRALPHSSGEGEPAGWDRVLVVEVVDGVARVAPLEEDRLLDS